MQAATGERPIALPPGPTRERIMRITPFLDGERFDPDTVQILGVALELTCIALRTGDCADDVKHAIADKLIALAKTGERNSDV
jgi:hypothetical protein